MKRELDIPIQALFELYGVEDCQYEEEQVVNGAIEVDSPNGFVPIRALVRKNCPSSEYTFDDGTSVVCADKHLFFDQNGDEVHAIDATDVIKKNGIKTVVGREYKGSMDVFDIALDNPHQYYTTEGTLHHNTTLAFLLLEELGVEESDILYISASVNNGIDYIREKVVGFAETMPFGEFKYVILDEADYVTNNGQAALRGIMQDYAETTRFILTCNYAAKIMEPLLSRGPAFTIDSLDMAEFKARAAQIIIAAGVDFTEEDIPILDAYSENTYPDLRKCINKMQLSCVGNKILPYTEDGGSENEVFLEMASLFKQGKFKDARTLVCKNISQDQYVNAYKFLYENVGLFSRDDRHECECLAIIKEGLVDHATAGDAEICLSGTLAKIYIS